MKKWLLIAIVLFSAACVKAQEVEKLWYPRSIATYPYLGSLYTSLGDWELHPGLNVSLSASAIIGVGKHASSGFANSAAVMYAGQLKPRLSFTLGGYSSFLDYGRHQMKDAGLTAMLNYRFDEHWEAGVFAQKSLMQPRLPLQNMWWLGSDFGDKIGAMVKYNFNPHFSLQVSVWNQRNDYDYRW